MAWLPTMDSWATTTEAKTYWSDATVMDDAELQMLLDVATEQCHEYAPHLRISGQGDPSLNGTVGTYFGDVYTDTLTGATYVWPGNKPKRYVMACIYQAREIRRASVTDGSSDVIGVGDFVIRARPLTATVKSLLRPKSRPKVG